MVEKDSVIKVAVVGNTRLTLKGLAALRVMPSISLEVVLGLNEKSIIKKVNSVSLDNFFDSYDCTKAPKLIKSDDWDLFYKICTDKKVNLIITLGDSRIIPEYIINSFNVIGNHGAVLPDVQGGASLVWGRMLNIGEWGVSIMEIDKKIDSGRILKVKKFNYNSDCSELEFTERCDDLTIEALQDVLDGNYVPQENTKWDVKINKHTDSFHAVNVLSNSLSNGLNVYMPPRTPKDSLINDDWSNDFKKIFKIANNSPYPKWLETPRSNDCEPNKSQIE